jgi:hypothetical protein
MTSPYAAEDASERSSWTSNAIFPSTFFLTAPPLPCRLAPSSSECPDHRPRWLQGVHAGHRGRCTGGGGDPRSLASAQEPARGSSPSTVLTVADLACLIPSNPTSGDGGRRAFATGCSFGGSCGSAAIQVLANVWRSGFDKGVDDAEEVPLALRRIAQRIGCSPRLDATPAGMAALA